MNIDLVLCSRPPFCCYAQAKGMLVGARSDSSRQTSCCAPRFVDFNFHKPDFEKHLAMVKKFRPKYAVAPDLFTPEQLPELLYQAQELELYAENVIVVPKYFGAVRDIPTRYVIGLPTISEYALKGGKKADVYPPEYYGRRVHILGGSPHKQYRMWCEFPGMNVVSIDGNAYMLSANYGDFWDAELCGWNRSFRGKGIDREDLIRMSIDNVVTFWRFKIA